MFLKEWRNVGPPHLFWSTLPKFMKKHYVTQNSENLNVLGSLIIIATLIIKDLYGEQHMKIWNKLSTHCNPTKGLIQGCYVSPTLFKICLKDILKKFQAKYTNIGLAAKEFEINYMLWKLIKKNHLRQGSSRTQTGNNIT